VLRRLDGRTNIICTMYVSEKEESSESKISSMSSVGRSSHFASPGTFIKGQKTKIYHYLKLVKSF
jgi:hypothetical protein